MKKLLLFLIINCVLAGGLYAQEGVFSVILNKGDNLFGSIDIKSPVLLGTAIRKNDVVKVVDGGYLALVHEATGASLELTKKGDYTVDQMEVSVRNQSFTVLDKYGIFLMNKLNPNEEGNQNLNVTGAVERGELGLIKVNLPKVMDLFGSAVFISWQQTDDVLDYIVTIKDKLDEVIVEKPVRGNQYILNLENDQLSKEKIIIVNIRAKYNEELYSRDFGIKRLSEKESKKIEQEFSNLTKVTNSENALDKLLIASFFEENLLIADAINYYNQALVLSPDPDGFNKLYDSFMVRNGLSR